MQMPKRETKAEWHRRLFGDRSVTLRRGSWTGLACGDKVYAIDDPRHVGRLEAIIGGYEAKIKWDGSGWISHVPINKLKRI